MNIVMVEDDKVREKTLDSNWIVRRGVDDYNIRSDAYFVCLFSEEKSENFGTWNERKVLVTGICDS